MATLIFIFMKIYILDMVLSKFISINQQKFLLEIYNNGKKCSFLEQNIFKYYRGFERNMTKLRDANLIKVKATKINNKYINVYQLTYNGILFIEEYLKPFSELR